MLPAGVNLRRNHAGDAGRRRFWDPEALEHFAMTFPARVRVHARDRKILRSQASVPRGGAGHPTEGPDVVSRTKLATWGPRAWGDAGTAAIAEGIDNDADDPLMLLGAVTTQDAFQR